MEPKNAIRRVATAHLLFMGDLNRFKAKFLQTATLQCVQPDKQQADEIAIKKVKEQSLSFYNRAKTVFPHEGKVYHLLAQLASRDSDHLSAIYNCMRALSCSYPSTSSETRELLINVLEEIRIKDIEECRI